MKELNFYKNKQIFISQNAKNNRHGKKLTDKKTDKYTIAAMILYYGVLDVLKNDLIEYTENEKIRLQDIRDILKKEVLQNEVVSSPEAIKTFNKVKEFYINRKKEKDYWDKISIDLPDIFSQSEVKKK